MSRLNRKLFVWLDWCNIGRLFFFNSRLIWRIAYPHVFPTLPRLHRITHLPVAIVTFPLRGVSIIPIREFTRRRMELWMKKKKEKPRHFSFTKLRAIWHSSRILKSFSFFSLVGVKSNAECEYGSKLIEKKTKPKSYIFKSYQYLI